LNKHQHLPVVLRILGDLGDKEFELELRQFSRVSDPKVAQAARDALRVLNAQPDSRKVFDDLADRRGR
jgi:hypothetical protein